MAQGPRVVGMPVVHSFDPPERFVAGTVGEPGHRVFYLQARHGARLVSVSLEKEQVAVLAERMEQLLDELMTATGDAAVIPAVPPLDLEDNQPLEQPIEEEFRVGTMTLSWDPHESRVVLEVFPVDSTLEPAAGEEPDPEAGEEVEIEAEEMLLVRLTPAAARAFCARADRVIEAGRPSCPFCALPIDPDGHLCVRANGFRRRPQ